ncbi:MAG: DUF2817 domain-containing protein [Phenylobacterium sp.]|nr:DUF2817 domain-containing protein [Phenylobacterium sp.]MCA3737923.1 DUF2817 domain-containing protein [Phenylobacterium sp.]
MGDAVVDTERKNQAAQGTIVTDSPFGEDYTIARAMFLQAAANQGATLEAFDHPELGPRGEPLATDIAWIGPADATRILVLISGTHGIEGYCGSGCQVDWLRRGEAERLPAGGAVLLVHALNPYGFAWSRRVTEDNVDLNRNWIDFSVAPPENPGFDELVDIACPKEWSPTSASRARSALGAFAREHGRQALVRALSGGQYKHPSGIFYGGDRPTWSRTTLTKIAHSRLSQAAHVGIIDYHTGLGPVGFGDQLVSAGRNSLLHVRAQTWHGLAVTPVGGGAAAEAHVTGDLLGSLPGMLPHALVTGIALEVGTVDAARVLEAVRAPLPSAGRAIAGTSGR